MATMDSIFIKEFKEMLKERSRINVGFNLNTIPVQLKGTFYDVSGFDGKKPLYRVSNVAEVNFKALNGTLVQYVPGEHFEVELKDEQGEPLYDALGDIIFTSKDIPKGSCAVCSTKDLGLTLTTFDDITAFNSYFGFIKEDGGMFYYYLPEQCLFKANPISLCVSFKKPKDSYLCYKVALTNGYEVFLSVVPLKVAVSKGYRVLGTKLETNFNSDLKELYSFWLQNEVIFDNRLCSYSTDYDTSCLSWYQMESNLEDYDYSAQVSTPGISPEVDEDLTEDTNSGSPADDYSWD